MPDFDVSRISDHPTPKKQKTNGEESIHANFDESIVFGEQSKEDNIFDFDISPENAEGGIDSDAGMSTNTIKTLSVLKEKISESTEKTVTFSDLAQSVCSCLKPFNFMNRPLVLLLPNYFLNFWYSRQRMQLRYLKKLPLEKLKLASSKDILVLLLFFKKLSLNLYILLGLIIIISSKQQHSHLLSSMAA